MKQIVIIVMIATYSTFLYGQDSDTNSRPHFPHHYFSVNPINCAVLQQAGISYEYKNRWTGVGITAGYIYPNKQSGTRFFITGSFSPGSFEYYSGFFCNPQVNFYLSQPQSSEKATLYYLSLKFVYKYLYCDSTKWHKWTGTGDAPIYRKQIDKVNLLGTFFTFGIKSVIRHFFIDFNIGVGLISLNHNMIVAGESSYQIWPYNQPPPYNDHLSRNYFATNISLNFGGAF